MIFCELFISKFWKQANKYLGYSADFAKLVEIKLKLVDSES